MSNTHKFIKDKAITMLCHQYDELNHIAEFTKRIDEAKKATSKAILNNCQCSFCIEAAYQVETTKFY